MDDRRERELATALCSRVAADLGVLGPRITRSIRAAEPEYAVVPLDDHTEHVTEQQRLLLAALAERRVVGTEDLERAAALGRLRATQGVGVAAVIGAYHVGNRELWLALEQYAEERERTCLPGLATLVLRSIEVMTSEIAAAYSSVAQARQEYDVMLRQRLIELLDRGQTVGEVRDVAQTLGLDPEGGFIAAVVRAADDPLAEAARVAEALGSTRALTAVHGEVVLVLAQGPTADDLAAAIARALPDNRAGLGLDRPGLAGARESLMDARLCLDATSSQQPVRRFDEDWLRASIRAQSARLQPVIGDLAQVVADNPHLVETLSVYIDTGFSTADTARVLHLHPNSVAYRLERWKHLTMWDPKTFRGLSQSILAIALVD